METKQIFWLKKPRKLQDLPDILSWGRKEHVAVHREILKLQREMRWSWFSLAHSQLQMIGYVRMMAFSTVTGPEAPYRPEMASSSFLPLSLYPGPTWLEELDLMKWSGTICYWMDQIYLQFSFLTMTRLHVSMSNLCLWKPLSKVI